MNKQYHTILLDPPWNERGGGKIKRGADRHYTLMKTPDIINLLNNVCSGMIADNAHAYLWVTNNYLPDGLKVLDSLGFKYVTCITWMKDRIGLGQYFRGVTEHCLFGVKGCMPYKVIGGKRQQGKTGFYAPKKQHSAKPEKIYQLIESVSYPPYLEMFARSRRHGWDVWGNQAPTINQQTINSFMGGASMTDPIIIDLCGGTGSWSRPYYDFGYHVLLVDTQYPDDCGRVFGSVENLEKLPFDPKGILAAPPGFARAFFEANR